MQKAESAPLLKVQAVKAKPRRAKPGKKARQRKVCLAFNRAEMAKMIDQIREEVEFHRGCADEVKAKLEKLSGTPPDPQPDPKEEWRKELDRELEKLLIIKKLLNASLPAAAEKKELPPESPGPNGAKRILVVDDDPTTVKIISHFLQKENYQVSTSLSGVEGLKKAFQEVPDLILLDVMMPDLNGFQFLSIYRKVEENARTPVVILSSLSEEAEMLKGLEIGAVDYITKPFSPQVLMAKIKKNLNSGP